MNEVRSILFALSIGLISCSSPKSNEYDKEYDLIKQRAKNDSIAQANEVYFTTLLRVNKEKLLFLDFWEGMTLGQFQYAKLLLLKNKTLSQDTLPQGVSEQDWEFEFGCGKKFQYPYIKLQVGDYEEKGWITNELDDSTKLVNSVGFNIVRNYKPLGQTFCTIAPYTSRKLISLFKDKYGKPSIEDYERGIYIGKVYVWSDNDKIIQVSYETYFNNEVDYTGSPLIVDLWVNYIFKSKKDELKAREKLIERLEREGKMKILNETKEKI